MALFDARTGAHLRRFDLPSDWLEALTFSADGTRLAALSTDPLEYDSPYTFHVRVWNPLEGETVFSYSGKTATPHLALSSDGRKLAFVNGQQVQVIDIDTKQEVAAFPLPKDFSNLALDRNGSRLALITFADGETARPATLIFDTATRARVAELGEIGLMSWSQDGTFALAYGNLERGQGPMLLDASDFSEVGGFINGKLHHVVLEATPSYIDDTHYAVSGTLELDEDTPIAFTGQVKGSEAQRYLTPQARLPSPAELTLKLQGHPWTLQGFQEWENPEYDRRQVHDWEGYVIDTTRPPSPSYATDGRLTLDRATASP